jgi:hypothetical protein
MPRALEDIKLLQGKLLVAEMRARAPFLNVQDAEFRVFSQTGDDGIIQYLIDLVRPVADSFILGLAGARDNSSRHCLVEYNSVFGPDWTVTVPYDPRFERTRADHSNFFFGASLAGLHCLGASKAMSCRL